MTGAIEGDVAEVVLGGGPTGGIGGAQADGERGLISGFRVALRRFSAGSFMGPVEKRVAKEVLGVAPFTRGGLWREFLEGGAERGNGARAERGDLRALGAAGES